jgi:hypothetical protein
MEATAMANPAALADGNACRQFKAAPGILPGTASAEEIPELSGLFAALMLSGTRTCGAPHWLQKAVSRVSGEPQRWQACSTART